VTPGDTGGSGDGWGLTGTTGINVSKAFLTACISAIM
jgi:hypothetical protein